MSDEIEIPTITSEEAVAAVHAQHADPAPEPTEQPEVPVAEQPETPAEPEQKVKRLEPWAEKAIADEAFKRREEARLRKEAEAQAEALRKEIEAIRTASQPQQQPGDVPTPQPVSLTKEEFERAVAAEAQRRASEAAQMEAARKFNETCNNVYEKGKTAFPDFEMALKNLGVMGVLDQPRLEMILATDEPDRVLYELGADPSKATEIFSKPPMQMAVELAKMTVGRKPAAPAPISKAPAPVKPVDGTAKVASDPKDDDDDQTYFAKRIQQRRERAGR